MFSMIDFFNNGNSLKTPPDLLKQIFESIYGWVPDINSCFLGVNLQWPDFDLPKTYSRYFLSWHTEQFHLHWLREQAQQVYPKPILVAYDGFIDFSILPDNVSHVRWITWAAQLDQLVNRFGVCDNPQLPQYKLSSLSFRVSQYKRYVTAYLLQYANPDSIILTYHNNLGKEKDLHGYPDGCDWLDSLNLDVEKTFINFQDGFTAEKNRAVDNGGWRNPAFEDALVNFTNESFHYSLSHIDGQQFLYPGPYLTEKTWKPLLAGRPFLAVSQWHTYKELEDLGLKCDFGFPKDFDSDPGDLTRIRALFQTIDFILKTSTKDLYEQSYESVIHNVRLIKNGDFASACNNKNEQAQGRIQDFISV